MYHIWHKGVSPLDNVSCTFMIPKTTFTFDLEVEFIGFMTWPCVRVTAFLSFDIAMLSLARVTSVSPWYGVSRTFMTFVWPWILTSLLKLYFYQEFEPGKIVLRIGVLLWDKFCVHSWPLYDLDLWPICGWLSLVSFTHSFSSCLSSRLKTICAYSRGERFLRASHIVICILNIYVFKKFRSWI